MIKSHFDSEAIADDKAMADVKQFLNSRFRPWRDRVRSHDRVREI